MKVNDFMILPEKGPKTAEIGERFLDGTKMIEQKNTKKIGDIISFFMIISRKSNKHYEYTTVMEKLEE